MTQHIGADAALWNASFIHAYQVNVCRERSHDALALEVLHLFYRLCQMLMLPRVFFANTHMHHFSSLSLSFLLLVVEDLVVQASGEEVGVGSVQNQALGIKEEVDLVLEEDLDKNRVAGLLPLVEEVVVV